MLKTTHIYSFGIDTFVGVRAPTPVSSVSQLPQALFLFGQKLVSTLFGSPSLSLFRHGDLDARTILAARRGDGRLLPPRVRVLSKFCKKLSATVRYPVP